MGVDQECPPKDHPDDAPPAPGRHAERDFKGEKRSSETRASTSDPDARLYRKGDRQPSRPRKTRHRGVPRVGWTFTVTAADNRIRVPKPLAAG